MVDILRRKAADLEKEFEPVFTSEHPSTKPDPCQPCTIMEFPFPAPQHALQICHSSASTTPESPTGQTFKTERSFHRGGHITSCHCSQPSDTVWLSVFPGYHTQQSIFLFNNCYSFEVNISRNSCFSCHLVLCHFCLMLTIGEDCKRTQGVTASPW